MDDQLQQLIELQREQNGLLKHYLWRLRFSLYGLLLMTTALAVALGIVAYRTQPTTPTPPARAAIQLQFPSNLPSNPGPVGDLEIREDIPGAS